MTEKIVNHQTFLRAYLPGKQTVTCPVKGETPIILQKSEILKKQQQLYKQRTEGNHQDLSVQGCYQEAKKICLKNAIEARRKANARDKKISSKRRAGSVQTLRFDFKK